LLHLLRGSGYRTVEESGTDPTICRGAAGLEVSGRGCEHQIDAIADFQIPPPFSHPQRLLVEAKCFSERTNVGIEVARNAVGVLKDVSEFWITSTAFEAHTNRYHYQYALFSATPYTLAAQRYAFAQDIYLIPLAKSAFMAPAIAAIRSISATDFGATSPNSIPINLSELRTNIRTTLRRGFEEGEGDDAAIMMRLRPMCQQAWRINYSFLAILGGRFPVFLVPSDYSMWVHPPPMMEVRIRWDDSRWYLDSLENRRLFSFDLPEALYEQYAVEGMLTAARALDLKQDMLRNFYAFLTIADQVAVVRFQLDMNWLDSIRQAREERET